MTERPSAVSVGDVFIDHLTDLGSSKAIELEQLTSSINVPAEVETAIGGSGLQLAVAAKCVGFGDVSLIAKVGGVMDPQGVLRPDADAQRVLTHLDQKGVTPLLALDPKLPTGRAILVYLPGDRRLMVSDPQANASLTLCDLTAEMRLNVAKADFVHVSGYCLLQAHRRQACLELLRQTRSKSTAVVALDLVPHDIDTYLDVNGILGEIRGLVDALFVELPTAYRILYQRPFSPHRSASLHEMFPRLEALWPVVILHTHPSRAVVVRANRREELSAEYCPGRSSRGQSAHFQASIALKLLGRR